MGFFERFLVIFDIPKGFFKDFWDSLGILKDFETISMGFQLIYNGNSVTLNAMNQIRHQNGRLVLRFIFLFSYWITTQSRGSVQGLIDKDDARMAPP